MTDSSFRRAAHRAGISSDLLQREKDAAPTEFFPNGPLALTAGLQNLGFTPRDVFTGKRYAYRLVLHVDIAAAGSVAPGSFSGNATASLHRRSEIAAIASISSPSVASLSDTSLTTQLTAVANTPGAYATVIIEGSFNCNGSGQIAPSATIVAGLTVHSGSRFELNEF